VRFDQLRRFFSPAVAEHLLRSPELELRPQVAMCTVMFADLSGYTALAERLLREPDRLLTMLNRWLDAGAHAVLNHGGTLDKFIGDAVMAVFGVPIETPDAELRAVGCALEMRASIEALAAELGEQLEITVGINTGPVVAGTVGTKRRLEYTVLGDTVNVAARLQGRAERGEIIVGPLTAAKIAQAVALQDVGLLEVKNHAPVQAYRVLGMLI
jgi:adenylate cyclase